MPECLPLRRVRTRDLVAGLRDPERLRGDADAPAVERSHGDAKTSVLLVKQPVATDPRTLDDDVVRRGQAGARNETSARRSHTTGWAVSPRSCAPQRSRRHRRPRGTTLRAPGCTTGSPPPLRRTPPARTLPSGPTPQAAGTARAESDAPDPIRPRGDRSRPARARASAPESPADPASGRSPRRRR